MKNLSIIQKFFLSVLAAGIILIFNLNAAISVPVLAAHKNLKKNTIINGIDVGGLSVVMAREKIIENIDKDLKQKTLVIKTKKSHYCFFYPEIYYTTNLDEIITKAQNQAKSYCVKVKYHLNDIDNIVQMIAQNSYKNYTDAQINFYPERKAMFEITPEKSGIAVDKNKLKNDINSSINGNFNEILIKIDEIKAKVTKVDLEKNTFLKSSFYTSYIYSSAERKHNIALASSFINGVVLHPGEEFSFNKIVGLRTKERGFKEAKIILDGKYVEGIGGGICQLSTTLYNAVLTAGLKITEQHPHSMTVPYIEPSFDAMVNSYTSDLRFMNDTEGIIFLKIIADGQKLTVNVYGEESLYEYRRVSIVTEKIPPPEPEIIESDTDEVLQYSKDGLKSLGFLEIYKDNKFVSRVHIRKDSYKPTREIRKKLPQLD